MFTGNGPTLEESLYFGPKAPDYKLTVWRALLAFGVCFLGIIVGGLVFAVFLNVIEIEGGASSLNAGSLGLPFFNFLFSLIALLWWTKASSKYLGAGFLPQLGWRPNRLNLGSTIWLCAKVFVAFLVARILYLEQVLLMVTDQKVENTVIGWVEHIPAEHTLLFTYALGAGVAVLGPIVEEVLFRGYLQSALKSMMPTWAAVLIASLVFALFHGDIAALPIHFAAGIAIGIVFERTGSLLAAIGLHAFNNALAFILALNV
ncbi:MAG: hypothetical protein COB37_11145 [Kordiimonadales bacterium]|nr:MAG: hypothetical protein COB37_11145 [Kordiimonadales bacterium]